MNFDILSEPRMVHLRALRDYYTQSDAREISYTAQYRPVVRQVCRFTTHPAHVSRISISQVYVFKDNEVRTLFQRPNIGQLRSWIIEGDG